MIKPRKYARDCTKCIHCAVCSFNNPPIKPKCYFYKEKDKLSIKSNGDIIDFEGRVIGHIDLEVLKGGNNNG